MEKKEKNWLRRHWILMIVLVCVIAGVIGSLFNKENNVSIENLNKVSNTISPEATGEVGGNVKKEVGCPNFSALSDRISCYEDSCGYDITSGGIGKSDGYKLIPWGYEEGDIILGTLIAPCRKGSEKGENINYFYCEGMHTRIKETDSSGNIIKSTDYNIKLVVNDSRIIDTICEKI